jgi:hypothetical protein
MSKNLIPEDWAVVLLGFVIIILSLAGLQLSVPEYNWSSITQLTGKILIGKNLLLIAVQFIYVYIIAIVGSFLIGKPVVNTAKAFLIVYLLTTLALIAAGSSQMKALSLEAVIFSLLIGLIIGNLFKLRPGFLMYWLLNLCKDRAGTFRYKHYIIRYIKGGLSWVNTGADGCNIGMVFLFFGYVRN